LARIYSSLSNNVKTRGQMCFNLKLTIVIALWYVVGQPDASFILDSDWLSEMYCLFQASDWSKVMQMRACWDYIIDWHSYMCSVENILAVKSKRLRFSTLFQKLFDDFQNLSFSLLNVLLFLSHFQWNNLINAEIVQGF